MEKGILQHYNEAFTYWKSQFSKIDKKSQFELIKMHEHNLSGVKKVSYEIKDQCFKSINRICGSNELLLFTFMLAIFQIEMNQYSFEGKQVIAIPLNIKDENAKNNDFIPFIIDDYMNKTFKELLVSVKNQLINMHKYQNVPLSEVAREYKELSDINSITEIGFAMKNIHGDNFIDTLINLENNKFTFTCDVQKEKINIDILYKSDDDINNTIEKILKHFEFLANKLISNSDKLIGNVQLIEDDDLKLLKNEYNNTTKQFGKEALTIHQLFEEQVKRTPDNIALVFENTRLSYKQLNDKANVLAQAIMSRCNCVNCVIGIATERSAEMIVAMLGILKSGNGYLPIDIEAPYNKIDKIVKQSDMKFLLVNDENTKINELNIDKINIDESITTNSNISSEHNRYDSDNLAYVIFTSGSTGTPKGVMINHKSIVNSLLWKRDFNQISDRDTTLINAQYYFDSSVLDIFTALISGAKMVILNKDNRLDINCIKKKIKEEHITYFTVVPNLYKSLLPYIYKDKTSIRNVTLAGEAFPQDLVDKHYKIAPNVQLCNEYGPTENSVCSTAYKFSKDKTDILIGNPISNVNCYVLDRNKRICPIGIPGELYLSGPGISRGYINLPKQTSDSFLHLDYIDDKVVYKTGDLVQWTEDGKLKFIGRVDYQVKVRGYRIELEEIENTALSVEGVNECAAIAVNDMEDKEICLYYSGDNISSDDIKKKLQGELPSYMHPQKYVKVSRLPLNNNGKVDRAALPHIKEERGEYIAPRNQLEEILHEVFCEVLKVDKVSIKDNFFNLGGHSIKVINAVAILQTKYKISVSLIDIFENSTIEELSKCIQGRDNNKVIEIEKAEKSEFYPLSSAQISIYNAQNIDLQSLAYNLPMMLKIKGNVTRKRLEDTFDKLIKRHGAFRTSFEVINGTVKQVIHDSVDFSLEYKEIESEDLINKEEENFIKPFNLSKAPLLRAVLVKQSQDLYYLIVDMHHIISDAMSLSIIVEEFSRIYNSEELKLPELEYVDFAVWEQDRKKTNKGDYWIKMFSGNLPLLNLPIKNPRPEIRRFNGDSISFDISKELAEKIKSLSVKYNTTVFTVLFTAFNVLMHKISGQEDIVVGIPTTGRNHSQLKNIVGMFVNTLAIRSQPEKEKNFSSYLKEMIEITLRAFDNEDYHFDDVLDAINYQRDMSRNPLFDVMFAHQSFRKTHFELKDLQVETVEKDSSTCKFEMILHSFENEDELSFDYEYNTDLFDYNIVNKIIGYFKKILIEICEDDNVSLKKINILGDEERKTLLYDFNSTSAELNIKNRVHEIFEAQVKKTPNSTAVTCGEQSLTYKELNELSNSLARSIITKGIQGDNIVPIISYNSIYTIIGILAVLKSGAAYLPIDPKIPKERIEYIVKDSKAKLVLVGEVDEINKFDEVEVLELKDKKMYDNHTSNLEINGNIKDLAYVIYTSGTTGKPKGVMIQHNNLINYVDFSIKQYYENKKQVIPLYSSIGFDLTVTSIFPPLLHGDEIIIYKDNDIIRVIEDNKSTVVKLTPAHLELVKNLDNSNSSVKTFIVGGDELKVNLAKEIYRSFNGNVNIYNEYGPTETTVGCILHKFSLENDTQNSVLIGKPIQNAKVYILDKSNEICPIGVLGEICIGGVGVGRGYLYKDTLNSEKFIENPYCKNERIYRTGDLGKWNLDGEIEFSGRIDNQVKIRGFRIELSEIENQMAKIPGISESVVLAIDKEEDKFLCAYYVGTIDDANYIKKSLSLSLPEYMIPAYFIKIDEIPLTQNGKVDKKQLPAPEYSLPDYVKPRNDLEKKLEEIYCKILKLDKVSIYDHFFDLGGNSLRIMELVANINSNINANINIMDIFQMPTIESLASFIKSNDTSKYLPIPRAEKADYYPLSSAQKRIFILQNLEPDSIAYNIPSIFMLKGNIDRDKIKGIFEKLIDRHEIFRSRFQIINDEPVQTVLDKVEFNIVYKTIDETNIEDEVQKNIKAFNLDKPPLLNIILFKINPKKHVLLVDMHHIVSDGASSEIFIKEFVKLYNGEELDSKIIDYKDFAVWQNTQLIKDEIQKQAGYWKDKLSGELPVLKLDTDFTRPSLQSFEGESIEFTINKDLIRRLRNYTEGTNITLFMVLFASFKVLLYKYSSQEDIIVGVPVLGRNREELLSIIGMFVNVLPIRSYPKGTKSFKEFLDEIKDNTISAFDNQDFQFEDLIDILNVRRDTSRNPIFDVMFSFESTDNRKISLDNIEIEDYEVKDTISKFDITLNGIEDGDNVYFSIEYCKKIFKKDTIKRMAEHYINILNSISSNSDILLDEINILTQQEKQLYDNSNRCFSEYPKDKTFYSIFEEQVRKTPDNIAVIFKDESITYKELNKKANQLARQLRQAGVGRESKVAILLNRGIEIIISVLGVMKSGGAYIPLDITYPKERINYILNDCNAVALIKDKNTSEVPGFSGKYININDECISKQSEENLDHISFANDLIYLIYTSGTTGNPKGVMVEYRNITNIASAWKKEYELMKFPVNVLQYASFSFDVFCGDICKALLNGGKLVICSEEERLSFEKLYNIIKKYEITLFESTPSLIVELMKYVYENNLPVDSLKLIILGSDVCKVQDFKTLNERFSNKIRILNSYGLTETAIDSCFYEDINDNDRNYINVPIGKPMQNNKFYILDNNLKYLPVGVSGELYIGGEGVTRGYINNDKLTLEKFVDNPYSPGERLYKTGDLVKWLDDGNLEFIGRKDSQVKIRGYRIETSEVENVLLSYKGMEEVAVVPRKVKNDLYLCAYYSTRVDNITADKIKKYLSKILPNYMIPSYFIQLAKLPLSSNGKVDKKALPLPQESLLISNDYEGPKNKMEEELIEIWKDILEVEKVGINDNFFELGGHSLKAILLIEKVHRKLGIEIKLSELFRMPTIKAISSNIESLEKREYTLIPKAIEQQYYPLSSSQKRLFITNELDKESVSYNMPTILEAEGTIDLARLESVLNELIRRHEILRTSFEYVDGRPVQIIRDKYDFKINVIDVAECEIDNVINGLIMPFNLKKLPLIRVNLIRLQNKKHILMLDMHHIISDGISMDIIINEIATLYNGQCLKNTSIQYKDYCLWQRDYFKSSKYKQIEDYWLNKTKDFNYTELPQKHVGATSSNEGKCVERHFGKEEMIKIKDYCSKRSITKFAYFASIIDIIIMNEIGSNDISVGVPIAGRDHDQLQDVIGLFLNVLILRMNIDDSNTINEYVKCVNETLVEAMNNKEYPYEELYGKLVDKYGIKQNSLFSVMLNYMPYEGKSEEVSFDGVTLKQYESEKISPKYDVTFYIKETKDGCYIGIVYNSDKIESHLIKRMADSMNKISDMILSNENMVLKDIEYGVIKAKDDISLDEYFDDENLFDID